jgi:hypothetical protein
MTQLTGRDRLLAGVSAAQLATGLVGMVVGLRRRHPYDVFWMHGSNDAIGRDVLTKGTALSAPVSMLVTQAALTAVAARRPNRRIAQALGGLGATLVAGYLGERQVRRRLRPSGWDAVESPLLVAAIGLAASMASLGRPGGRGTATARTGGPTTALAGLLGDVRSATAFRYDAHDSLGNRMDTAKVIASPTGGYLAVYHSGQTCHLATSTDLMAWTHQAVIDQPATQPTIAATPDGGLLTAAEFNDGHGGQLRIRYWPTLEALLAGRPAREFLAPRMLSACNEGTPSIRQVSFDAGVDASRIELGLHYHRNCQVDRQARATLTGFQEWTATTNPQLDAAVERAAAAAGEQIGGNIGDRDHLRYRGKDYDLVEGEGRRDDFASWRVYLYDRSAGSAQQLNIVTHGGSTAFANPTATVLRDPAGRQAVMLTLFVPMEGAAPGEAGSLLYHVPVDHQARRAEDR